MNYLIYALIVISVWLFIYAIMDGIETRKMHNKTKGL